MSRSEIIFYALFTSGTFFILYVMCFVLVTFQCLDIEANTGHDTKMSAAVQCYVHVDGRWIPKDAWRGEQAR